MSIGNSNLNVSTQNNIIEDSNINIDTTKKKKTELDFSSKLLDMNDGDDAIKNNAPDKPKTSKLATFGRVMLGIFTLGISEGIRYLVNKHNTKVAESREKMFDSLENEIEEELTVKKHYSSENISEGLSDEISSKLKTPLSDFEKRALGTYDLRLAAEQIDKDFSKGKMNIDKYHDSSEKLRNDFVKNMSDTLNSIGNLKLPEESKDIIRKEIIIKGSITSPKELASLIEIGNKLDASALKDSIKDIKKKGMDETPEGGRQIMSQWVYFIDEAMKSIGKLMLKSNKKKAEISFDMMNSRLFVVMQAVENKHPVVKEFIQSFVDNKEKVDLYDEVGHKLSIGLSKDNEMDSNLRDNLKWAIDRTSAYLQFSSNKNASWQSFSGISEFGNSFV